MTTTGAVAEGRAVSARVNNIRDLIGKLSSSAPLRRKTVEGLIDIELQLISRTQYTVSYEGHNVELDDATIDSIDYREPAERAHVGNTFFLSLAFVGACIEKSEIENRYGPLKISMGSHMELPGSEIYMRKEESWGRMSFGFPTSSNCLKTVVFSTER